MPTEAGTGCESDERTRHIPVIFLSAASEVDKRIPALLARIVGTNEKRLNQAFQTGFALPVFAWLRDDRLDLQGPEAIFMLQNACMRLRLGKQGS